MAYVIASLEDGNVSIVRDKHGYRYIIELKVTDPKFAITFSRVTSRLLNKKYIEPRWDEKEKKWRVEYYSKSFYEWYKKCEKKGLEGFKPFIEHNKNTVTAFLRGLYDAEGYNYRNKQIWLYNTKKQLLEYAQYLLKNYLNIISTGPYLVHKTGDKMTINGIETTRKHDYYAIEISRKEHIQKFLSEIGFTIMRKQLGVKKYEKVPVEEGILNLMS